MFEFLRPIEKIEEEVKEEIEPVDKETMQDMINLIDVAHSVGCFFELEFALSIGVFAVDSASYTGIKFIKKTGKNDFDKVIVSYKDALLSNETSIALKDIAHISLDIKFCDKIEKYLEGKV